MDAPILHLPLSCCVLLCAAERCKVLQSVAESGDLDEDDITKAIGFLDDIGDLFVFIDTKGLGKRVADGLPHILADAVEHVDEYGVEDGEAEDLKWYRHPLFLCRQCRVLDSID